MAMDAIHPAYAPLISCRLVPDDFLNCDDLIDLYGNTTLKQELGYGCTRFGGQKYHDVEFTSTPCTVVQDIECHGNRTFLKDGFPCIRYTDQYFLTTLLYSILLGLVGLDRFSLGHPRTAVAKMFTLGGCGIWWIIDVVLLIIGELLPADSSNWIPQV